MKTANIEELRRIAAAASVALTPIELDVTSDASVGDAVDAVVRAAGRIDVLVNNAGIASAGVSESFSAAQVRDLFEVNVIGVHHTTRAALPILRGQRDGLIVNVGSVLGRVTLPFFGIYGASKFALEALTEGYRYELSQLGVDVALVQPSAHPTRMYANLQRATDAARAGERATRTIVGASFGSDAVNARTAPVQAEVVRGLGLAHLDAGAA